MWTTVWSFVDSKAGIIAVAALLFVGFLGWHKVEVVALKYKIATLKTDIQLGENKAIDESRLKEACEYSLGDLQNTVTRQNQAIDALEQEAVSLEQAAAKRVRGALTPPEEIERQVQGPPGNKEMNLFMSELAGRLGR